MSPLPYTDPVARIAFYVVLGIWLLGEVWIRLRSGLNRRGTRLDRGTLLVVVACVYAGL